MKTKMIPIAAVSLVSWLLTGCISYTTYNGPLEPVSPKPHSVQFFFPIYVESLHPTFKWHAKDSTGQVDLGIWEALYKGHGPRKNSGSYRPVGLVYFKGNIAGNEHEITTNLAPDTIYFWSIKPSGAKQWSSANHTGSMPGLTQWANGYPFSIRTPAQK